MFYKQKMKYAGWVWFNEPSVLKYLREHGFVYTARKKTRKEGWGYAKRGRQLLFKVKIEKLPDEETLESHVSKSGFRTVEEWKEAILRQHGSTDPQSLGLFRVELLEVNKGKNEEEKQDSSVQEQFEQK